MIKLCWQYLPLPYTPNKMKEKFPLLNAPFSLLCLVYFLLDLASEASFPEPFVEILEGWTIEFGQEFLDSKLEKLFSRPKKPWPITSKIIFLLPQEKPDCKKLVIRVDYQHNFLICSTIRVRDGWKRTATTQALKNESMSPCPSTIGKNLG